MQPLAGLVVAGTPVDVQTGSLALAMMAECIGIAIASTARAMASSCIGGIADEKGSTCYCGDHVDRCSLTSKMQVGYWYQEILLTETSTDVGQAGRYVNIVRRFVITAILLSIRNA